MSSNTIRAQAASAVLALMDDEIKYVKYRYPRNDDERSTYVAKITVRCNYHRLHLNHVLPPRRFIPKDRRICHRGEGWGGRYAHSSTA